jgi:hypothetical protein
VVNFFALLEKGLDFLLHSARIGEVASVAGKQCGWGRKKRLSMKRRRRGKLLLCCSRFLCFFRGRIGGDRRGNSHSRASRPWDQLHFPGTGGAYLFDYCGIGAVRASWPCTTYWLQI